MGRQPTFKSRDFYQMVVDKLVFGRETRVVIMIIARTQVVGLNQFHQNTSCKRI